MLHFADDVALAAVWVLILLAVRMLKGCLTHLLHSPAASRLLRALQSLWNGVHGCLTVCDYHASTSPAGITTAQDTLADDTLADL